jgi:uncharacterized protein Yka (UPF0111/DUF47 family)
MSSRQENLIKLHEDAEKLVNNIEQLAGEITLYKNANMQMEGLVSSLSELVGRTKELTAESHKIIGEFNNIGGTQILDRIQTLHDMIKGVETELQSVIEELNRTGGLQTLLDNIQKVKEGLENKSGLVIKEIDKYASRISDKVNGLSNEINDLRSESNKLIDKVCEKVDEVDKKLDKNSKLTFILLGVSILAAISSWIILLFK